MDLKGREFKVNGLDGEVVIYTDVIIIGCGDVKWMIMLSLGMKLLAAEGLMYDPGLIECAEFDWFSVRCLEDASSFTSHVGLRHFSCRAVRGQVLFCRRITHSDRKVDLLSAFCCLLKRFSWVSCHYQLCLAIVRARNTSKLQSCVCWNLSLWLEGAKATSARVQVFHREHHWNIFFPKWQWRYSNHTLFPPCDSRPVWLSAAHSAPRCCRWGAALSNCCCGSPKTDASNPMISVSPQQWRSWAV